MWEFAVVEWVVVLLSVRRDLLVESSVLGISVCLCEGLLCLGRCANGMEIVLCVCCVLSVFCGEVGVMMFSGWFVFGECVYVTLCCGGCLCCDVVVFVS